MGDEVAKPIEETLSALEIPVGAKALDKLAVYAIEIVRFSKRINLTGASTVEDFVRGPFFDALTLLKVLEPEGTLVDIGSGGGLPGIPAAIVVPDVRVTLVEPRSRRVAFLNRAVHMLDLKIEIMECRDEDIADRIWDGAVAQAVWPPHEWISRARRLIEPDGAMYVLTSSPLEPGNLPLGLSVTAEYLSTRPWDGKRRYSARLGVLGG